MKKIILAICLSLIACTPKEEVEKPSPKIHQEEAPPLPPPPPVNPFARPAPLPVHEAFKTPHWEQQGDGFKMNKEWTIWTWRDTANHNTCNFYTIINEGGTLIGHGVSCVKE
jgi:hypothetical protein